MAAQQFGFAELLTRCETGLQFGLAKLPSRRAATAARP
jgi:hypothetical protein